MIDDVRYRLPVFAICMARSSKSVQFSYMLEPLNLSLVVQFSYNYGGLVLSACTVFVQVSASACTVFVQPNEHFFHSRSKA